MNEKIRILTIYSVFVLIISCKNYASGKDSQQNVKAYLDKGLMQGDAPNNSLFNPPPILPPSRHDNTLVLKAAQGGGQKEVKKEDKQKEEKEEIEKKIQELKDKIEKSDSKKTSLETYLKYEEEIKKIREELEEKLKDKEKDKEELKKELETLEKTLKEKIEKRKKDLEDAKKKFEEFKQQIESANGVTYGDQVQRQGNVGQQAWSEANELGLRVSYSSGTGTDSNELAKKVIDDAIKKIEEELKKLAEPQNSEDKK